MYNVHSDVNSISFGLKSGSVKLNVAGLQKILKQLDAYEGGRIPGDYIAFLFEFEGKPTTLDKNLIGYIDDIYYTEKELKMKKNIFNLGGAGSKHNVTYNSYKKEKKSILAGKGGVIEIILNLTNLLEDDNAYLIDDYIHFIGHLITILKKAKPSVGYF